MALPPNDQVILSRTLSLISFTNARRVVLPRNPIFPAAPQGAAVRPTIRLDLADAPNEPVGQTLGRYGFLERVIDEQSVPTLRGIGGFCQYSRRGIMGGRHTWAHRWINS